MDVVANRIIQRLLDDDAADGDGGGGGGEPSAAIALGLGKFTTTGNADGPTFFDPASTNWDDGGWWQFAREDTQIRWYVGNGPHTYAELDSGQVPSAGTVNRFGGAAFYAEDDDGNTVVFSIDAQIHADGSHRDANMTMGASQGGLLYWQVNEVRAQWRATALPGQVDPIVDVRNSDGLHLFEVVAQAAEVDDVWTVDKNGGEPIEADAGSFTISSDRMDDDFGNTITVTVGDNEATIQATADAALGAGLTTIAGDWESFTITFHSPVGVFFGVGLWISANSLTLLGEPTSAYAANTVHGHGPTPTVAVRASTGQTAPTQTWYDENGDPAASVDQGGPIVYSPDGTAYRIVVANGGALSTVAV